MNDPSSDSLPAAVARSVAAAERSGVVTEADQAAVDLAMRYALVIDSALERGGDAATSALFLGPHLQRVLGELGCSPSGRLALPQPRRSGGKLEARRRQRRGPAIES